MANRIIPSLSPMTRDREKSVREQVRGPSTTLIFTEPLLVGLFDFILFYVICKGYFIMGYVVVVILYTVIVVTTCTSCLVGQPFT